MEDDINDKIYSKEYLDQLHSTAQLAKLIALKRQYQTNRTDMKNFEEYITALNTTGYHYEAIQLLTLKIKSNLTSDPGMAIRLLLTRSKLHPPSISRFATSGVILLRNILMTAAAMIALYIIFRPNEQMIADSKNVYEYLAGQMTISNSKAKTKVKFDDVIGIEEYKDEIVDIVKFLKDPSAYHKMGAEIPRGILLTGPPGTGKTLLAKALADEAGCNFYYISGAEIDSLFVGVGAKKIRELFEKARENSPSIIFIDEIDALAMDRTKFTSVTTDNSTVNQLLVEMDGFRKSQNVIVIGATNLADRLDSALMRPGRFDKTISIPLPDIKGREKLFDYYIKRVRAEESIDSKKLADKTTRMSGADIATLVNMAIIHAVKAGRTGAKNEDFEFVIEQYYLGTRKTKSINDEELKKRIAYYESAKAVMSLIYPHAEPVFKMTILSRGDLASQTVTKSEEDKLNYNKKELKALIMTCLAGRTAEIGYFGEISTSNLYLIKKAVKTINVQSDYLWHT